MAVEAEHRAELRRIHQQPEVYRWWGSPSVDWPDEDTREHGYVVLIETGVIIGYVQWWDEPEPTARHAGIDIFLDPSAHGRGFGAETVAVLAAHLIDGLGFHRLVIDPAVDNAVAIACYQRIGFRPVGVMRSYELGPDGTWHDALLHDLLADELIRV